MCGSVELRHQRAQAQRLRLRVGGLGGEPPGDLALERHGAVAIARAHGGIEFGEQVFERDGRGHGEGGSSVWPLRGLAGGGEELVDLGLQFAEIDVPLAQPSREGVEGGIGEEFGEARNGRRRAGGAGAAEVDDVVAEAGLQMLAQVRDERVDERGELVAAGFGGRGRVAAAFEVIGDIVVRYGAVHWIGQGVVKRERAALLCDRFFGYRPIRRRR